MRASLFVAVAMAYSLVVAVVLCWPHRFESQRIGKMELHQWFAAAGNIASLGLVERRLVDWYTLGATIEENIPPYDRYVRGTVARLTPFYLGWFALIATLGRRWPRRRAAVGPRLAADR